MRALAVSVVHLLPGRVRLRIPSLRGDAAAADALERLLRSRAPVTRAAANPVTASVVVHFEREASEKLPDVLAQALPGLDAERLSGQLREAAELHARRAAGSSSASPDLAERVDLALRLVNARLGAATGGADLRVLAPAALVLLGGYRLVSSPRPMPGWSELLWYGFNTFFTLNQWSRSRGAPLPPT